jgi:hypothetical protein
VLTVDVAPLAGPGGRSENMFHDGIIAMSLSIEMIRCAGNWRVRREPKQTIGKRLKIYISFRFNTATLLSDRFCPKPEHSILYFDEALRMNICLQ